MKVNIRLIAEMTGFSPATVSNALNKKRGVNSETAKIITKKAKELGYDFEPKQKKIKFLCCKRHGRIINDSPFFASIIAGAEEQAKQLGYSTAFVNLCVTDTDYPDQLQKALNDESCVAFMLLGTELKEEDYEPFSLISAPLIVVDGFSNRYSLDSVVISNAESVQSAVQYLIDCGHTEIGYLRGKHRINAFMNRALGYKRAMSAAGLKIKDENIVTVGTALDTACADMCDYLEVNKNPPSAFFADNDLIALGAMRALQKFGYSVPDQVSIIGFDDLKFCEICTPRLTTMRVYKEEMGRIAVSRLIYKITKSKDVRTKTLVYTDFIERDSVKRLEK